MIIRAITISKKKVQDKYTVYFYDGTCLSLSSNPDSPQGVSQWGQYFGVTDADIETGSFNDEKVINWFDLPVIVQAHAEQRIREAGQS
jgi:hypothetical protein